MRSVKQFIRENNLTFEQFGGKLGVSRGHISKLLTGDRLPSLQLLRKIHEITDIPVKDLLYEFTD